MANKRPPLQQFNLLELGEPESPGVAITAVANDDTAITSDAHDIGTEIIITTEIDTHTIHSGPGNDAVSDEGTDANNTEALVALNSDGSNDSDPIITDANEIINAPYGYCHCGAPILIPGLGSAKCSRCGWRGGY